MVRLQVGTSKGLIAFEGEKEVAYDYAGLNVTAFDEQFVAITHKHWGVKLYKDGQPCSVPSFGKDHLTVTGQGANLKEIWNICEGGKNYPDRLWAATEPGALFKSEDGGSSWKLVEALWNHPTRTLNNQWFGAGKDLPFVHSIIVHPENNDCVYVSVSCAGIFRTKDSGKTWEVMNTGMRAEYLPNPHPFAGYDPHHVLMHPKNKAVLWQQNHCGVYRSEDSGNTWKEVSSLYGFCIAIDEEDPDQAWIIPVESETSRIPRNSRLQVLHTVDQGKTWSDSSKGLPLENFYSIVLRNGLAKKGRHMAFGTTNGNVYYSSNKGKSWSVLSTNLAKVNYIRFSNLSS